MSQKISAMTHDSNVVNAGVIPWVTGGANKNCSKAEFLFAAAGETIQFGNSGGSALGIDTAGRVFANAPGLTEIQFAHSSGAQFYIDTVGKLKIDGASTSLAEYSTGVVSQYQLGSLTSTVASVLCVPSQSVIVTYFPIGGPPVWQVPAPGNMAAAITRIAAALAVLMGGPIP